MAVDYLYHIVNKFLLIGGDFSAITKITLKCIFLTSIFPLTVDAVTTLLYIVVSLVDWVARVCRNIFHNNKRFMFFQTTNRPKSEETQAIQL